MEKIKFQTLIIINIYIKEIFLKKNFSKKKTRVKEID